MTTTACRPGWIAAVLALAVPLALAACDPKKDTTPPPKPSVQVAPSASAPGR